VRMSRVRVRMSRVRVRMSRVRVRMSRVRVRGPHRASRYGARRVSCRWRGPCQCQDTHRGCAAAETGRRSAPDTAAGCRCRGHPRESSTLHRRSQIAARRQCVKLGGVKAQQRWAGSEIHEMERRRRVCRRVQCSGPAEHFERARRPVQPWPGLGQGCHTPAMRHSGSATLCPPDIVASVPGERQLSRIQQA
jgi:hypothetical protein